MIFVLGAGFEADSGHCFRDRLNCRAETHVFRHADLRGELTSELHADLLRDLPPFFPVETLDDAKQQLRQQIVATGRELHRDLFGGRLVVLGRSSGAGALLARPTAMGHAEISVGHELVEVMACDVGVQVEDRRDLGGRHRFGRLTDGDVDAATRGIAER